MKYKSICIFMIVFVLAGCSARGPLFQEVDKSLSNEALIYIYRLDSFVLGGRKAYFYVDDINIADLSNNGYTWFILPEGEYELKQKWPFDVMARSIEMPLIVKSGEKYYFRLGTDICSSPGMCIEWSLTPYPEELALRER